MNSEEKAYKCRKCDGKFSSASNRRRHEKRFHRYFPESDGNRNNEPTLLSTPEAEIKQVLKCSECSSEFSTKKDILAHLSDNHPDIQLKVEKLQFKNREEFEIWKRNIEKETASWYVFKRSNKNKDHLVRQYMCHRSGSISIESNEELRKRHLKFSGSNKSGCFCPAHITVREGSTEIDVTFVSTHLGHLCEVGRIPLSLPEKNEIAGLMATGVPIPTIMDKISLTASPTKRLALTKTQDLRNIRESYGIRSDIVRCSDEVISVDSWVQEMKSQETSPILISKLPGEAEINYKNLKKTDLVLAFMNDAQEEILKLYGQDVILIDSTHGTNKYDIQLTSLVVKDDNWEGFPVAFLWSNRQNEDVFELFFNAIKERIGQPIKAHTFMSDDFPAFYNAWRRIFSPVQFHLICDWHVKGAFKKNLTRGSSKVTDPVKRNKMYQVLCYIVNETDRATFEKLVDVYISEWEKDPETTAFVDYFKTYYRNRPEQWAACYREGARLNTNMTCERWHYELKYNSDLQGKCNGRLDIAIHSLMKSLRKKMMNRLASITRGKLTKKVSLLRNSHKTARSFLKEIGVMPLEENVWLVPSFSKSNEFYKVKKVILEEDHKCNTRCDYCKTCIHEYVCKCPESSVKYNMCKHIHLLCIKTGIQEVQSSIEESTELIVNESSYNEASNLEMTAISYEIRKNQVSENLKETAKAALLGFIPKLDKFTSEAQYKEIIKTIAVLESKCLALSTAEKHLPPTVSNSAPTKKIECQRSFPLKKKRKQEAHYVLPEEEILDKLLSKQNL